jgi:hypothetical protein
MKYNTASCASACADQYFAVHSTCAYSRASLARKTHILSPARLPFHHSGTEANTNNEASTRIQERCTSTQMTVRLEEQFPALL